MVICVKDISFFIPTKEENRRCPRAGNAKVPRGRGRGVDLVFAHSLIQMAAQENLILITDRAPL